MRRFLELRSVDKKMGLTITIPHAYLFEGAHIFRGKRRPLAASADSARLKVFSLQNDIVLTTDFDFQTFR